MMRIAVPTILAAAFCGAALPGNQADVLAPTDAKSQELKELLALDSFNVTSSDAEQNRMHAVCDMEYRLSKSHGMSSKAGLGINNLLVNPAAPQFPWNPFTMPLAAVKAHIALLKQEEDYLQAQSDAFDGSGSSGSSSAAPAIFEIPTCARVVNTCTSAATCVAPATLTATDAIMVDFTNLPAISATQTLAITVELVNAPDTTTVETWTFAPNTAAGSTAFGAGTGHCLNVVGADAQCKGKNGAALVDNDITAVAAQPNPANAAVNEFLLAVADNKYGVTTGKGGLTQILTLKTGLEAVKTGKWFIGTFGGAGLGTTATAIKTTFKFEVGAAAASTDPFTGEVSCTLAA